MALIAISETETQGTYINFRKVGYSDSGKTERWEVNNRGDVLGWVYWYSPWRKYMYHPKPGTLYEETCLTEIAEFVAEKTDEHRLAAPRPIPTCPLVGCAITFTHHHDNHGPYNTRVKS